MLFNKNFKNFINKKIQYSLNQLNLFIKSKNKNNIKITGYGASAKTVMLINLLGVSKKNIKFIVDNTKSKQNKFLPGTDIPVIPPNNKKNFLGKYCIIFSWNFAKEIISKEKNRNSITKWVTPIPKIKIS